MTFNRYGANRSARRQAILVGSVAMLCLTAIKCGGKLQNPNPSDSLDSPITVIGGSITVRSAKGWAPSGNTGNTFYSPPVDPVDHLSIIETFDTLDADSQYNLPKSNLKPNDWKVEVVTTKYDRTDQTGYQGKVVIVPCTSPCTTGGVTISTSDDFIDHPRDHHKRGKGKSFFDKFSKVDQGFSDHHIDKIKIHNVMIAPSSTYTDKELGCSGAECRVYIGPRK